MYKKTVVRRTFEPQSGSSRRYCCLLWRSFAGEVLSYFCKFRVLGFVARPNIEQTHHCWGNLLLFPDFFSKEGLPFHLDQVTDSIQKRYPYSSLQLGKTNGIQWYKRGGFALYRTVTHSTKFARWSHAECYSNPADPPGEIYSYSLHHDQRETNFIVRAEAHARLTQSLCVSHRHSRHQQTTAHHTRAIHVRNTAVAIFLVQSSRRASPPATQILASQQRMSRCPPHLLSIKIFFFLMFLLHRQVTRPNTQARGRPDQEISFRTRRRRWRERAHKNRTP